jgi:transposase InsO family protein
MALTTEKAAPGSTTHSKRVAPPAWLFFGSGHHPQGADPPTATAVRASRRSRHAVQRYAKEVPGERVQIDTCKIKSGLYQYTAVDASTRIRVLALYSRRTAAHCLLFLERVIEEMPFPVQRIQTDRGREFFSYKFQEQLMAYGIIVSSH